MKNIKKYKSINDSRHGFTLLEVLLYVSIFGILVLSFSGFFSLIINSRSKGQAMMEINNQGSFLVNMITQKIRNTEDINLPSVGTGSASLSLDVVEINDDPTIFNTVGDVLYITEGVNSSVALTNNRVLVSNLNFNNVSLVDTPGLISFQFMLSHINLEGRQEYNYSKIFYGSASLK
jgi:prepilin-type N-terminal cleavage/methylation domain-containing protein